MAAHFEIILPELDDRRGAQVAQVCFDEIDRVEAEISRWNPSSETGVINALKKGGSTMVSDHCFNCLLVAREMYEATDKLFDVTIGPLLKCWLTKDYEPREPSPEEVAAARARTGFELLQLDAEQQRVLVKAEGVQVDFGGIGKGFALDVIANLLREDFDLKHFLLNAGDSTVYGVGPEWKIGAGGQKLLLDGHALSGSSLAAKGRHIIHPHTGKPVNNDLERAWSIAPLAAKSDALSTAFMIMSAKQVQQCCQRNKKFAGKRRKNNGQTNTFGTWPQDN
jgi:thiamine biosynthesis lipoprotein